MKNEFTRRNFLKDAATLVVGSSLFSGCIPPSPLRQSKEQALQRLEYKRGLLIGMGGFIQSPDIVENETAELADKYGLAWSGGYHPWNFERHIELMKKVKELENEHNKNIPLIFFVNSLSGQKIIDFFKREDVKGIGMVPELIIYAEPWKQNKTEKFPYSNVARHYYRDKKDGGKPLSNDDFVRAPGKLYNAEVPGTDHASIVRRKESDLWERLDKVFGQLFKVPQPEKVFKPFQAPDPPSNRPSLPLKPEENSDVLDSLYDWITS